MTPETETSCWYFWSTAIGYRQNESQVPIDAFNEVDRAFQEDRVIIELQQASISEVGEERLINIAADGARIQMRRVVSRMLSEDSLENVRA